MLRVAICDDDVKFTGRFESMLLSIAENEHIQVYTEVFLGGRELVESICNEGKRYDIIFLDIEMKDMDGLLAAKEIRKIDEITSLIYVTNHRSYAIEAYEVQPFQFMVKQIDIITLHRYFMKAYEKVISGAFYFQYKYGKDTYRVLLNDIVYFESKKRVIYIHMADGTTHKYYDKLNEIEEQLKTAKVDFWRIHQSYLVNSRYITRMSYDQVELSDKKQLFISEERRKMISEKYCDSVGDKIIE